MEKIKNIDKIKYVIVILQIVILIAIFHMWMMHKETISFVEDLHTNGIDVNILSE